MQQNILRDSNVTKIFLTYVDNGARKKVAVSLRFMDEKECFFGTPMPINFKKPKRKIAAELKVYTTDGIYKSNITLIDTNTSIREVLYEVSIPKTWNYIQMRTSSRKLVQLPITVKYNDGFEIQATSYDLSLGGVSFFLPENKDFSSIYKKINGILSLELPRETLINFPEEKMVTETKFVREEENIEDHFGEKLFVFKFINIPNDDFFVLKDFLIKLY